MYKYYISNVKDFLDKSLEQINLFEIFINWIIYVLKINWKTKQEKLIIQL